MSAQSPPLTEILTKLGDDWSIAKNRFDRYQSKDCVGDDEVWELEDENRGEALHNHPFPWVLEWVTVRTGISNEKIREATLKHFDDCTEVVEGLCRLDDKGQTRELWERLVKEYPSVLRNAGLMPDKLSLVDILELPSSPCLEAGMEGKGHEKLPSAEIMLAIADEAEKFAEVIWNNTLTNDPKSPARLPCFGESMGPIHEQIRRLDWLFHGRNLDEVNMDFRQRWEWFCSAIKQKASPDNMQALTLQIEWERNIISMPGPLDLQEFLRLPPTEKGKLEIGFANYPLGWNEKVCGVYRHIWRLFCGLKVYFGHLPIFSLSEWMRTPQGWKRKEENKSRFVTPPQPKEEVDSNNQVKRIDDGLPMEWLDGLRDRAANLRETISNSINDKPNVFIKGNDGSDSSTTPPSGEMDQTKESPKIRTIGDLIDLTRNGYTGRNITFDSTSEYSAWDRLLAYAHEMYGKTLNDVEVLRRLIGKVANSQGMTIGDVRRLPLPEFWRMIQEPPGKPGNACDNASKVRKADTIIPEEQKQFIEIAEEIITRIEESDGPEWWADISHLSVKLEEIRRRLRFFEAFHYETKWPAFFITSIYGESDELYGIAAEYEDLLKKPLNDGNLSAYGTMLTRDPYVASVSETLLWGRKKGEDSDWTIGSESSRDKAIRTLRKWIRTVSKLDQSSQNASDVNRQYDRQERLSMFLQNLKAYENLVRNSEKREFFPLKAGHPLYDAVENLGGLPSPEPLGTWLSLRDRSQPCNTETGWKNRRNDVLLNNMPALHDWGTKELGKCQDKSTYGTGTKTDPTLEGQALNNTFAKPSTESNDTSGNEYVFMRSGTGYLISGFNESGHVKNLKGFQQLAILLQSPGKPIPMTQLVGADKDDRILADKQSSQPVLTEEAKQKIREQIRELNENLDKAKRDNDPGEADNIRKEIEKIEEHAKAAIGIGGKDRDLNNPIQKLRTKIHGTLKTAYKSLRDADPTMKELADHFEASISAEASCFIYRPTIQPTPNWSWSEKSQTKSD